MKKNIEATKIADIMLKGGCKHIVRDVGYAIVDNKVYNYGRGRNYGYPNRFKKYL